MLEYLRQRSQSAIIVGLVVIISLVFIIQFGPQSQGCGSEGTIWLAEVYGSELGLSDYRWVERLVTSRYRLPREYVEGGQFARDVLNGLIERELLVHHGNSIGLRMGVESIDDYVVGKGQIHFSWPAGSFMPLRGPVLHGFRDDEGVFKRDEFDNYIKNGLQLNPRTFRFQQAKDILAERVRQLVELSVMVSDDELYSEYSRFADRVNLKYVRVYPAFFRDAIRFTKADLESWARQNSENIRKRYEADSFRYRNVRKQLRIQDIMVKLREDATDEERAEGHERAKMILDLAKAPGADFGVLARCFSDDPQSTAKSGDLGFLRKGMSRYGREFDEVVFELEPGTISDIIETKRGLHIVKVTDQREGDVDFEQAKLEIAEKIYRTERGEKRAEEVIKNILARAIKGDEFNDSLLEGIVELEPEQCPQLGGAAVEGAEEPEGAEEEPPRRSPLQPVIRETGFFNRGGLGVPGIGESSELMSVAFDLTEDDPVASDVIKVRDDLFVVRLADEGRRQPTREEFEEQRPGIESRMLRRKRQEALRIFMKRLVDDAERDGAIERNPEGIRFITRGQGGEEEEEQGDEGGESESSSTEEGQSPEE